ncbi:hypothetical protein BKA67DRAFT_579658 [Truncatella angustata]|uniref:Uncharacterized protein n=1 Tax=Truncatella angustata TaxID=152316 RepID=A0A9P8UDX6_9PEZI|nr:uncharacterized protein BKA67DRAFT_579658 [Truncatella angustata]KAH6648144.1 hypothetical protein BKA67DRAFT_579658 [Truncatella angustata]
MGSSELLTTDIACICSMEGRAVVMPVTLTLQEECGGVAGYLVVIEVAQGRRLQIRERATDRLT